MPQDAVTLKISRNVASFRQQSSASRQKGPTYISSMLLKLQDSFSSSLAFRFIISLQW